VRGGKTRVSCREGGRAPQNGWQHLPFLIRSGCYLPSSRYRQLKMPTRKTHFLVFLLLFDVSTAAKSPPGRGFHGDALRIYIRYKILATRASARAAALVRYIGLVRVVWRR